jgi:hypothetical protein
VLKKLGLRNNGVELRARKPCASPSVQDLRGRERARTILVASSSKKCAGLGQPRRAG